MEGFNSPETEKQAKDLLIIASNGAKILGVSYKELSRKSFCEVILFASTLILGNTKLNENPNFKNIEEDYFLLLFFLLKKELPTKDNSDLFDLINDRLYFYHEEYGELVKKNTYYTPLFIYNRFYKYPLGDESVNNASDVVEVILFNAALLKMITCVDAELSKYLKYTTFEKQDDSRELIKSIKDSLKKLEESGVDMNKDEFSLLKLITISENPLNIMPIEELKKTSSNLAEMAKISTEKTKFIDRYVELVEKGNTNTKPIANNKNMNSTDNKNIKPTWFSKNAWWIAVGLAIFFFKMCADMSR